MIDILNVECVQLRSHHSIILNCARNNENKNKKYNKIIPYRPCKTVDKISYSIVSQIYSPTATIDLVMSAPIKQLIY